MKKLLFLCLVLVLMLSAASAETILMYGTVVYSKKQHLRIQWMSR